MQTTAGNPTQGTVSTRRRLRTVALLATTLLLTSACASSAPADRQSAPVRLGDQSWESIWIANAIVGEILQSGYGRSVEIVTSSTPIMQQALVQGDIDINIEIWPQNIAIWWDEVRQAGTVRDLGLIMDETRRGFYIPRYVVEGDPERGIAPVAPDLRTLGDLARYATLFPDQERPGRGQIISCVIGWACAEAADVKAAAYGLDETFDLLRPGSSTAMDAAIVSAYRRGAPVAFYYWEPTWLASELDLVKLEMDPWTPECEAATVAIVEQGAQVSDAARCDFPTPSVSKAANAAFADANPEIVAFLTNMYLGTDRVGELAGWMNTNDTDADAVARHYLRTYPDEWTSWVPAEVAEKVLAALG